MVGRRCDACEGTTGGSCVCRPSPHGTSPEFTDRHSGLVRPYVDNVPVIDSAPPDGGHFTERRSAAAILPPSESTNVTPEDAERAATGHAPEPDPGEPSHPADRPAAAEPADSFGEAFSGGGRHGRPRQDSRQDGRLRGRLAGLPVAGKAAGIAGVVLAVLGAGALFGTDDEQKRDVADGLDADRARPTYSAAPSPSPTRSASASPSPSRTTEKKAKSPKKREKKTPKPSPSTASRQPDSAPDTQQHAACAVDYQVVSERNGDWQAGTAISYLGGGQVDGWTLTWQFPDGREIVKSRYDVDQSGSTVTVSSRPNNKVISQDAPVYITFEGQGGDPGAAPTGATLNGSPCTVR